MRAESQRNCPIPKDSPDNQGQLTKRYRDSKGRKVAIFSFTRPWKKDQLKNFGTTRSCALLELLKEAQQSDIIGGLDHCGPCLRSVTMRIEEAPNTNQ